MSTRYQLHSGSPSNIPDIWPIPIVRRIEEREMIAGESEQSEEEPERPDIIPATMAVEWKTDPSHGNFNTGTQLGHKMSLKKTKGLVEIKKRFDLTKKHDEIVEKISNKKQNTKDPEDNEQEKKASTNSTLEIQENVK